jgi:ribosomal protein L7/L12
MPDAREDKERELVEQVQSGSLIAAVKLYREITGVSLKEAKEAVEAIRRGARFRIPAAAPVRPPDPSDEVERLLAAGRKIEAVKVYRQAHQTGLKEAKQAVDAIEARLGGKRRPMPANLDPFAEETRHRLGCLTLAVLLLCGLGGLAAYLFWTGAVP